MGGRVTVTFADGRVQTAEQIVPSGMAGDPNRLAMVREKLIEETRDVFGHDRAHQLLWAIDVMDTTPVPGLLAHATTSRTTSGARP